MVYFFKNKEEKVLYEKSSSFHRDENTGKSLYLVEFYKDNTNSWFGLGYHLINKISCFFGRGKTSIEESIPSKEIEVCMRDIKILPYIVNDGDNSWQQKITFSCTINENLYKDNGTLEAYALTKFDCSLIKNYQTSDDAPFTTTPFIMQMENVFSFTAKGEELNESMFLDQHKKDNIIYSVTDKDFKDDGMFAESEKGLSELFPISANYEVGRLVSEESLGELAYLAYGNFFEGLLI
ncbi:hypothetical protein GUI12_00050 [Anaplasmataceae bacterium AB001_6]|nr:hypothetical protein GUI12_00050 [Anaplasmataceae bacterium AB001_6]